MGNVSGLPSSVLPILWSDTYGLQLLDDDSGVWEDQDTPRKIEALFITEMKPAVQAGQRERLKRAGPPSTNPPMTTEGEVADNSPLLQQ